MPAAAKFERQTGELTNGKTKNVSSNGVSSNSFHDPPKIVNSILEKKIRNLEKRKARLLELKALEVKGQQLEAEQKIAVTKLDGVVEMIDMLKEIGKNVTDGLNDHAKQLKKQQKKEQLEKQAERQQQDLVRLKLLLNVQFLLSRFSVAKDDLLQGLNGATKLEKVQVNSLESLSVVVSPQEIESFDHSAEKINMFLEGNKKEFVSGISYSDLKETIVKLIEANYLQNLLTAENTLESSNNTENNETILEKSSQNENVQKNETSNQAPIGETLESKPVENVQQQSPLCFIRDPVVVENELQNEDPAVVAVASSGFVYSQNLPTSSGNITSNQVSTQFTPHVFPPVCAIPSQTYTNANYTLPNNAFIPVTLPAPVNHIISNQQIPISNNGLDSGTLVQNENFNELTNEKEILPENLSTLPSSHESEANSTENGQFNKRNNRPNFRGNNRGGYGGYRGGRGGKNYGYFNNGNNVPNNQNGNFQNRPINRQNGGGNGRPGYRPRNPNYTQQSAPVPAK